MASFAGPEEVYEHVGALFEELIADDELLVQFRTADTVVQYRYSNPDAMITVDVRQTGEPSVVCGETDLEPEIVMAMEADVAHRFWLGEVNITIALARGQIHTKGPVGKILRLVPAVKHAFPRYRERFAAAGREDPART